MPSVPNLTESKREWLEQFPEQWQKEYLESGEFDPYAWPGGYQIIYYDKNMEVLCPTCASNMDTGGEPAKYREVFWEGPSEFCSECNKEIESAYGDPEEEEEDNEV